MPLSAQLYLKQALTGIKLNHMTLAEAKLAQPNIYESLLSELYFEGCTVCAKYFEYLICEEDVLVRDNFISQPMSSNKPELIKLFDTCKAAEHVSRLKHCNSRKSCYELLYQALNITTNLPHNFSWLEKSFLDILVEITDTYGVHDLLCSEIRAKIYTHYALLQRNSKMCHVRDCGIGIKYFEKALTLCRLHNWRSANITNVFDEHYLHQFVGLSLAKLLTLSATTHLHSNPKLGIQQVDRSIMCIAEVSQMKMKILVVKAILVKARLLMELGNFKDAMKQLRAADRYVTGEKTNEYQIVRCELNICKGVCYDNLGLTKFALAKLKLALFVARLLKVHSLIGLSLLEMGKIYTNTSTKYDVAEKALKEARKAFAEGNDMENQKRAKYMYAKLELNSNISSFIRMIKNSHFDFCELHKIRKWKYQLSPYWTRRSVHSLLPTYSSMSIISTKTVNLLNEESESSDEQASKHDENSSTESLSQLQDRRIDPIYCLLDET